MCAAGDQCDVHIGQRVEHQGFHGTVRYVGEVAAQPGLWIGVEWDEVSRGKHDGSHNGVQYFKTNHPTSGSLVRLSKLRTGQTCVDAIRSRYGKVEGSTAGVNEEQLLEMKRELNAAFIELVGFDKVNSKQSNFEKLHTVVLRNELVHSAGDPGQLAIMCPSIVDLNLSHNLIGSWKTLAEITRQLPYLRSLDISENRLAVPSDEEVSELSDAFKNLRSLRMIKMAYTWTDILKCATFCPHLLTLMVQDNNISTLESPQRGVLSQLETLYLQCNPISAWEQVNNLGNLKSLKELHLSETGIKEIFFPGEATTSLYPALCNLWVCDNLIDNWSSINELNKLLSLENLHIKGNPLVNRPEERHRFVQMIFARIRRLQKLNGSELTAEEGGRKGAEYDYMKRYGPDWLTAQEHPASLREFTAMHPRYAELIEKHGGAFGADELIAKPAPLNSRMVNVVLYSPDYPDKPRLNKKLPKNMSIQKLAGLVQKLMDTKGSMPRLTAISAKVPDLEVSLEKDLQDLSYYSVEDGDTIAVRW